MVSKDIENILEKAKQDYKNIPIPDNIDEYIKKGIEKGKKHRSITLRRKFIGIAATFIFMAFLLTVRLSPTFAQLVSNIPGIEYIVKLINYDKGLMLAVENNFIQHIGVSDEHEALVFTVEDIIVDESRMILFYSIENKGNYECVNIHEIQFLDQNGENLPVAFGLEYFTDKNMNIEKKLYGKINISFSEEMEIPDNITIKAKLVETKGFNNDRDKINRELNSTWNLVIPINKERFKNLKEVYAINKTIEIEGQKITFEKLTLYPTRIALDIKYDKNNSKKIFSFVNLKIVDENKEYASIKNGVTATHIDENRIRLFMESNYFTKPKELYIVGSGIKALEKNKVNIKVDLENKKIINPPDNRLVLKDIKIDTQKKQIDLIFNLKSSEQNITYFPFALNYKDSSGEEYRNALTSSRQDEDGNNEIHYEIEYREYKNPIILELTDYHNIIKNEFKIKVK